MWYIFHNPHFCETLSITWWEEIAVQNVNFTFSFIFRTLKNCDKNIEISNVSCFTEKWRLQKTTTRLHMYIEAWSEIALLIPKCFLKKITWPNGTWVYTRWRECLHCLRIRVECTNSGDWSAYTSVTYYQRNASQIILKKKMLLIKSICPMWTHPWLKKKWETPKRNAAKRYIKCTFQDVKSTQEPAGSGLIGYTMFCVCYEIYTQELRSLVYIP